MAAILVKCCFYFYSLLFVFFVCPAPVPTSRPTPTLLDRHTTGDQKSIKTIKHTNSLGFLKVSSNNQVITHSNSRAHHTVMIQIKPFYGFYLFSQTHCVMKLPFLCVSGFDVIWRKNFFQICIYNVVLCSITN